jgi:hypothetical protein
MNSDRDTLAGGLPHSEIPGSPIARISPGLFAACHVLHRLSVPRHPPDALVSRLIKSIAVAGDATPPPRTGPNPIGPKPHACPATAGPAASMKTLLSDISRKQALRAPSNRRSSASPTGWAKRSCPGLSASVTSQLSLHPSISLAAVARGGVVQSSPNVAQSVEPVGRRLDRRHADRRNSQPAKQVPVVDRWWR